ncbi:DUF4956 domain-containing protein [Clostridiaceae bacterium M8S5]|nr:DUF4956 domain-containing protein [Clostridiaceae bacterium M8S5]
MNVIEFINSTSKGLTVKEVVLNMVVTLLIAMFIYFVYKMTYDGVMYSKSYNVTLVLVSVVTAMVMMVIGSNLALSLGMVGALSIIRFRAAVKDPKDIGFLFWGIAVGLASGTGSYMIAAVGSILIAIILFVLSFSKIDDLAYLLIVKGNELDETKIEEIVKNNSKKFRLKMRNISPMFNEIIYEVKLKQNQGEQLAKSISELDNSLSINIVSHDGEIAG